MSQPHPVLAAVVDDQGRLVVLTRERWEHIMDGHPELSGHQAVVMAALATPAYHVQGRRHGEEWFYSKNAGPSRWLKVVVLYRVIDYGEIDGSIVTAFPRRRLP